MVRLKLWQWIILAVPVIVVVGFLLAAAGLQIQAWGLSWIWAGVLLIFVGWRWLLVRWTRPAAAQMEQIVDAVSRDLQTGQPVLAGPSSLLPSEAMQQAEAALQEILQAARDDAPVWDDWSRFWQRCQAVVVTVAHIYHPEVKYPLLNIYVPQAYGLIRGTVEDMDRMMGQLGPVLNQVTVGQAYQAYEVYRRLEPSARKLWQIWNWAQWLINPAAAAARTLSQRTSDQANQQLLFNLSQLLRETALRNLAQQAVALYGGEALPAVFQAPPEAARTETLREILAQAEPAEQVAQQPVNILLVGRTGAGKSSLINTLFQADQAAVDLLPNTDDIQQYRWQAAAGEALNLWDTPGYEQVNRAEYREQVLACAEQADLLLLVTPALDPALQMDVDFLAAVKGGVTELPVIGVLTQVDRLRPLREWQPPYDWQNGNRPKEKAIREAAAYRSESLGEWCNRIVPVVTQDADRTAWNTEMLSLALVDAIATSKQVRLARFLRDQEARIGAAAQIIDRYSFQMSTTQGLTALLKSPILRYLSMLMTGSDLLARLLIEKIPIEQAPIVIGKLQMAYELYSLLSADRFSPGADLSGKEAAAGPGFDLLTLWPLLLETGPDPQPEAWSLGHALVEYWTQSLTVGQLRERYRYYQLQKQGLA